MSKEKLRLVIKGRPCSGKSTLLDRIFHSIKGSQFYVDFDSQKDFENKIVIDIYNNQTARPKQK